MHLHNIQLKGNNSKYVLGNYQFNESTICTKGFISSKGTTCLIKRKICVQTFVHVKLLHQEGFEFHKIPVCVEGNMH